MAQVLRAPIPVNAPQLQPKSFAHPAKPAARVDVEVDPAFDHLELQIEEYIKQNLNLKLDTDAQVCKDFLTAEGCPLGARCPKRHTRPSARNFRPPSPVPFSAHSRTICKHWLRGLCKKGTACDFLHEYNLRRMPECWHFAQFGFCGAGDECMYLHVGPRERRPECKAYTKGFCPDGPACQYKHVRRTACPLFLTGFCPRGQDCEYAHPPFTGAELHRLLDPEYIKLKKEQAQGLLPPGKDGPDEAGAGGRKGRRDLSEVMCFKCGTKGHYASFCTRPSVPGARGGVERGPGGKIRG